VNAAGTQREHSGVSTECCGEVPACSRGGNPSDSIGSYGQTMALDVAAGGRRINLRGCFDFRDVGGYRAADGLCTRWRSLYRSDGLHRLIGADRKEVGGLRLSSVIDLRTTAEVATQGPVRVGANVYPLPLSDVLPGHAGHPSAAEPALIAESYYETAVAGVETVREIFAILTDPSSYPAVVCCPSGVDRTGIVTALLLGVAGVPDYLIISDFAASREAVIRRLGRMRFDHPSAVHVDVDRFGPGLLGVVPEAMGRFLDRVRADHGSLMGYAKSIDMAGAVPYLRSALLSAS
jgi:protein-tyrosine phosphatase